MRFSSGGRGRRISVTLSEEEFLKVFIDELPYFEEWQKGVIKELEEKPKVISTRIRKGGVL